MGVGYTFTNSTYDNDANNRLNYTPTPIVGHLPTAADTITISGYGGGIGSGNVLAPIIAMSQNIFGGTFSANVVNDNALIHGGTFNSTVTDSSYNGVGGGTFHGLLNITAPTGGNDVDVDLADGGVHIVRLGFAALNGTFNCDVTIDGGNLHINATFNGGGGAVYDFSQEMDSFNFGGIILSGTMLLPTRVNQGGSGFSFSPGTMNGQLQFDAVKYWQDSQVPAASNVKSGVVVRTGVGTLPSGGSSGPRYQGNSLGLSIG